MMWSQTYKTTAVMVAVIVAMVGALAMERVSAQELFAIASEESTEWYMLNEQLEFPRLKGRPGSIAHWRLESDGRLHVDRGTGLEAALHIAPPARLGSQPFPLQAFTTLKNGRILGIGELELSGTPSYLLLSMIAPNPHERHDSRKSPR